MNFKKYIKAVATGPKGNKDLTIDETADAIEQILLNKVTPAQAAAFLIGWRTKYETDDELKGAILALRKFMKFKKIEDSIELGYSFDGRCDNPFLFPLYENILEEFYNKNQDVKRLNLVISGDYLQPAKVGITTKDIFTQIDEGQYIHFFDRVQYLKELSDMTTLRQELGLRTAFNTIEKLLNPSLSEYGVTTAFHKPYVQKYLDIFSSHFKKVVVLKGSEGSPEVFKDGKYWIKEDKEIIERNFSLKDFGISYDKEFKNITLEESLNIVNNHDNNILKLAKFNVALILLFANRVSSLDESWQRLN
ncbi:glycosyl transferase [Aliarcobacter butzleri]|uniref:glycosyl transferase n=1 Tax=Aliarcobacter butzleri TaxID=28197 RepID=UPI00263BF8D4|nr:glycosyl transferase [Aliarcobacter butzleri]MDN5081627.1 glycosyl transferase [Aliarcobacter butzleri]MDN5083788.1 glycosyl transferase [Aliarcobacter butzleri]MDN5085938.1 glycosyl transferase [Aliarcobacter butzleri]